MSLDPLGTAQPEAHDLDEATAGLQARPEVHAPLPAAVYTTDELAGLLKVSRRCIERWASAGRIPGRLQLPGRTVRWRATVIDEWIVNGCRAPHGRRRPAALNGHHHNSMGAEKEKTP